MGYYTNLSISDQKPFRAGLRRLKKALDDSRKFDELCSRGLIEVTVLAGEITKYRNSDMFGYPIFQSWADSTGSFEIAELFESEVSGDRRHHMFRRFDRPDEQGLVRIKESLSYLRDWLGDDNRLVELAKVGPCALHIGRNEISFGVEKISIGIENFVPGCFPNYDLSIDPNEGGIWFHS